MSKKTKVTTEKTALPNAKHSQQRLPKKKVERTTTVIPGVERTIKLPSGGTMRIAVGTVTMAVE